MSSSQNCNFKNVTNEVQEQIILATETRDIDKLKELSKSVYMNVRLSVAKNHYTPTTIVNELTKDCVRNVSYQAYMNRNCTLVYEEQSRDSNKCISCNIDPRKLKENCSNC